MSVSLLFLSLTGHSFRISHRAPRRAIPFSLLRAPSTVAPSGRGRREREKGTLRGPEIFFPLVIFAAEERTNGRRAEEHQRGGGGPLFFIPHVRPFVALSRCRQARRARNACGGVEEEGGAPLCQFARNFPTCSMLYCTVGTNRERGEAKVEIMWRRNDELSE